MASKKREAPVIEDAPYQAPERPEPTQLKLCYAETQEAFAARIAPLNVIEKSYYVEFCFDGSVRAHAEPPPMRWAKGSSVGWPVATDSHTYCGISAVGIHGGSPAWFGTLSWPSEISIHLFVGAMGIQLSAFINTVTKNRLGYDNKPLKKSVNFADGQFRLSYQEAFASLMQADFKKDALERWRLKLRKLVRELPQFP